MSNKIKTQIRSLNTSLSKQLKNNFDRAAQDHEFVKLQSRHKCYAVLRSKGGSGEMHAVKKLAEDLLSENKNILVCYETPINSDHFYTKFLPDGSNTFLETNVLICAGATGIFNCNWTKQGELVELINALNDSEHDYSVIFTCGTSGGGALVERLNAVIDYTEVIFVSVNSSDKNSIEPTRNLLRKPDLDFGKMKVAWWYEHSRYEHRLTVIPLSDLKRNSSEDINLLADDVKRLSMI